MNIAAHLTAMAARQPDTPAVIAIVGRNGDGSLRTERVTCRELDERSDRLAAGLGKLGIGAGTRVAMCVSPGLDFFALTFALFKLWAVPVLIDPGIGVKNFGRCLEEAAPAAFIGIPKAHLARRLLGWAKTSRVNVTTGWFGGVSIRELERAGRAPGEYPVVGRDPPVFRSATPADPQQERAERKPSELPPPGIHPVLSDAAILFTSGSTGAPKGVLYTHANFNAQIQALKDTYGISPGEMDLGTFPLFALFGPALGMTSVLPRMDFTRPGFVDPREILDPIRQFGITMMFGSPALIARVGAYGVENGVTLPTLRRVISAGAPVPPAVIERFATMLPAGTQIFTPYGATESLPVASIGSDEILRDTQHGANAGQGTCVGKPVNNMRVRIIKISDTPIAEWSENLELSPGEIGEICVQGPVVTRSYFHRDEATAMAKIADPASGGFYHRMGDVGYFDASGRLWFCGRKSQRVRTAAGDLHSMPFEGVFNTHPQVVKSALVGVTRGGEVRPVICVELRPGAAISRPQLFAELRALADKYPHTKVVKDFLVHPKFPVDIRHNAKIGREKLAVWAEQELPR